MDARVAPAPTHMRARRLPTRSTAATATTDRDDDDIERRDDGASDRAAKQHRWCGTMVDVHGADGGADEDDPGCASLHLRGGTADGEQWTIRGRSDGDGAASRSLVKRSAAAASASLSLATAPAAAVGIIAPVLPLPTIRCTVITGAGRRDAKQRPPQPLRQLLEWQYR